MPHKKEDLPINVDVNLQNGGSITYANEVIAIIAGVACNEVEGIAGMVVGNGFGEIIGRNLPEGGAEFAFSLPLGNPTN